LRAPQIVAAAGTSSLPKWAEGIPPYAIGSVAIFWVIERVAAFVIP